MHEIPEFPDELLMAFADGELRGAERQNVVDYLSRNPAARERVAMFALTRDGLIRLLNEPLIEPVPERLLATIMGAKSRSSFGAAGRAPPARRTATLWDTLASSLGGFFSRSSLALPAAALAAGAVAGIVAAPHLTPHGVPAAGSLPALIAMREGAIVATGSLASALESAPGGKPATLASADGAATLKPVLTFEAEDGRYCRQYTLTTPGFSRSAGLACRGAAGQWQIEAAVALGQAPQSDKPVVQPSGNDGEIEDKVARMMKGNAIAGASEQGLIDRHWGK